MGDSTTYVLLIRHGENDWVGQNRLAGRTPGVHLNEAGEKQAKHIADALSVQAVSAVYSSPLERCIETAQPVAESHGMAVTPETGVLEVNYGEWQGGSLKELSQSPEWKLVQHNPSSFRFPGGETLFEVQARAVETVERIRRRHPDEVVAVFSHGDVIRTTIAHYMGIPFDLFQRVIISTGSISAVVFHGPVARVLFTNRTSELPKFEFKQETADEGSQESAPKGKCREDHGPPAPVIL